MMVSYSMGGQSSEGGLSAAVAVAVGARDPGDERNAQFVAGSPATTVQPVLLSEREERFHRRVVACRTELAHRANDAMAGEGPLDFPGAK